MTAVTDTAFGTPAPRLRRYVRSYVGYRMSGHLPGTHIGMPSPYLTVIITIGEPLHMAKGSVAEQDATEWSTLASGISPVPCLIGHDGSQHGIQLALNPLGARALFGLPTAALGGWLVALDEILGADAREIRERVAAEDDWPSRFAVLDEVFERRADDYAMDPSLEHAWARLVGAGGRERVGDVADEIGWSRRHLTNKFAAEFGVTPKDSARIARFAASHDQLRRAEIPPLADVAVACGYYDQAHMAREWRELAGVPPSVWRANEVFAFVQDDDPGDVAHSLS